MTIYPNTIVLSALTMAVALYADAADVTGKWKAEFESQIGHLNYTYEIRPTAVNSPAKRSGCWKGKKQKST